MSSTTTSQQPPTHTTETITDRKKSREEASARASGQLPPEVDVKTGSMINPHNPEFITKRPWYLGGNDEGPSLDHQASQKRDEERLELSLQKAEELVKMERQKVKEWKKRNKLRVGMWVEALCRNKRPYRICQIIRIAQKGTVFDLRYENGFMEKNVRMKKSHRSSPNARIRMTQAGNRSFDVNHLLHGKETYDSKRDKYHGFEVDQHQRRLREVHAQRDAIRRKLRAAKHQNQDNTDTNGDAADGEQKTTKAAAASDSDSDYDSDNASDSSSDEFVQNDADAKVHTSRLARQGGVGGAQMKVTARNLRIREDTAKYLRNLDPNSAYYDPKSRSMRDNPNPEVDASELQFAGDNFARISGDAVGLAQTQVFAWDMLEKTNGGGATGATGENARDVGDGATATGPAAGMIHPQANPSQAELMKKKFTTQAMDLKTKQKKAVLDKYGGAEYLDGDGGLGSARTRASSGNSAGNNNNTNAGASATMDQEKERAAQERKARFGVSIQEEHYTRDGKSTRTASGNKANIHLLNLNLKSKYQEDVLQNGHTTVWGSYFHRGAFRWGFADDHSLMRNSYCTGYNGRIANDEANEMKYGTGVAGSAALAQAREMLKAIPKGISGGGMGGMGSDGDGRKGKNVPLHSNSKLYGEADQFAELDDKKLKAALLKEEQLRRGSDDRGDDNGDKKRKYNSVGAEVNVTEEEMEAYRLKKGRSDDPMNQIGSDEILEYKK